MVDQLIGAAAAAGAYAVFVFVRYCRRVWREIQNCHGCDLDDIADGELL